MKNEIFLNNPESQIFERKRSENRDIDNVNISEWQMEKK